MKHILYNTIGAAFLLLSGWGFCVVLDKLFFLVFGEVI